MRGIVRASSEQTRMKEEWREACSVRGWILTVVRRYGSRISAAKKEKEVRMEDKQLSRKKHNEVVRVAIAGGRSGCTEKYMSELERQHAASASSIQ
jgi:hypothetical protein